MDEIKKAKRGMILNGIGFCIGIATLMIDVIPVIAIGAVIFCPIYAIKNLSTYRKLKKLQSENLIPLGSEETTEYFQL